MEKTQKDEELYLYLENQGVITMKKTIYFACYLENI